MDRRNLTSGIMKIIIALGCLYLAISIGDHPLVGVIYGLAGAIGAGGIFATFRYFYWSKHRVEYEVKLEEERIEQQDELKQMLRNEAGKYTYWIGLLIIAVSIFIYSILELLDKMNAKPIVIFLSLYFISQVIIGIVVYNYLLKRYE